MRVSLSLAALVLVALPIAFFGCAAGRGSGTPQAGPVAGNLFDSAAVVSAHPLATAIGVEVLRKGGNAVDAAVAVHWALAVVSPWAGNIGGGGFMVGRNADGQAFTLDFREVAPGASTANMYLGEDGKVVHGRSENGHLAVGVPGTVAGLFAVHDSLGRLPMATLLQPAIDLAANGCALTPWEVRELNAFLPQIKKYSTRRSAFLAQERWHVGDTLRQPELARTLERIRDGGAAEFSKGRTADLLLAEMERGGGIVTRGDLEAYRPVWRPVLKGNYRDLEILTMGPPSSGGILLLQMLRGMEVAGPAIWEGSRVALLHRMVEVEKRAFADRASHLGDPAFVPVPVHGLLDPAYIDARMAGIDPQRATSSCAIFAGDPVLEPEHTTHFSVVDAEGNAVSCTTTLNGAFGSGVVVGGAGFVLNNEMDDFSAAPGVPNAYGLVGGEANAISPGKRMLSSMTPTIITRNNELYMVLGSPGGSSIPTTVFQTVLNVRDRGMDMQAAVEAKRFHHQWLPDTIIVEPGAFTTSDSLALVRMGHAFRQRGTIGRVDAVLRRKDGKLQGGADPRGDDRAGGY